MQVIFCEAIIAGGCLASQRVLEQCAHSIESVRIVDLVKFVSTTVARHVMEQTIE